MSRMFWPKGPSSGICHLFRVVNVKLMQDFVELAKWEDRGYHAMKSSTEKAQRQLHKMQRQAADVLKQPVAAVLAAAARTIGLGDLAAPEQLPGSVHKKGRAKHPPAIEPVVGYIACPVISVPEKHSPC